MSNRYDERVRRHVFDWFAERVAQRGGDDVFAWHELKVGVPVDGQVIKLIAQQGIFKPKQLDLPLTIKTTINSPYDDNFSADGLLSYRYRGTNLEHKDNVGLRRCMERAVPLVYFHAVAKAMYVAVWPVYIVGDDPAALSLTVVADEGLATASLDVGAGQVADVSEETVVRQRYRTREVRVRLHQRTFRERVLDAYRRQCSMCRLKHAELLDAAHITRDSEEGEPVVSNGLALCKIHHAAFDSSIIGVRPDLVIEVREDVLREVDGPMLQHGLQEMHGRTLWVPRASDRRPDRGRLEERYAEFRSA